MSVHNSTFAVLALAASAVIAGAPAHAQEAPVELRAGQFLEGRVGGGKAPQYRLRLAPGEAIQIDASAKLDGPVIDPRLTVLDGRTGEVLQEDDDGGGNLASRVRLYSRQGAEFGIRVDALEGAEAAFELLVRHSNYKPLEPVEVSIPVSRTGALGEGQEQLYHFTGKAGEVVVIDVKAEGGPLDPQVALFQGRGIDGQQIAFNDDYGRGDFELDAHVRAVLPETGEYTARVSTYSGGGTGTFRFSAQLVDMSEAMAAAVLPIGTPVAAAFDPNSMLNEATGAPYKLYRFADGALEQAAAAGQRLVVSLRDAAQSPAAADPEAPPVDGSDSEPAYSDDRVILDTVLDLGLETPLGFVVMRTDDDGGGDLSSRLELDLALFKTQPELLRHLRLRASTTGAIEGAYVIAAEPAP